MHPVASTVLFTLILAHVLAEFPFQPQRLRERKAASWWMKGLHTLAVLFSAMALTLGFATVQWGGLLLGYALLHLIIDELTSLVERKIPRSAFEAGVIDQGLHAGVIALITYGLPFYDLNSLGQGIARWISLPRWNQIALWLAGYVLVFKAGTEFVRRLLQKVEPLKKSFEETGRKVPGAIPPDELQVGRLVGNLERVLILTLVLVGQFTAIGFVLTAKSIARFKELEDRSFAEYFLIGTLGSSIFAIVLGLILSKLT